ncbi:hypothetical protein LTR84_005445 [Exophiala bonariae]|uniref:Uncharacterized protein n=1 Tax=Exophiala bonariae TaxID=1690606 RepID=A0AAV9N455_9EURO|nr:hypothetical protein LTR84_005445 [Exophiala bonariae]
MAQIQINDYRGTMNVSELTPGAQEILESVKAFMRGPTPLPFEIEREGGFLGQLNIRIWNTSSQSLSGKVFAFRVEQCARVTPEGYLEDGGCCGQEEAEVDSSRFEFEQVVAQLELDEELEQEDVVEMVNQLISKVLELASEKEPETTILDGGEGGSS